MFVLAAPTEDVWVQKALGGMDAILLDHAHCEKKAASTALGLIYRYPDRTSLLVPLARLAREELDHFEQVLAHMNERGIVFERQEPSPYAGRLMDACFRDEPRRLLDTLICCSLIEARSCERMRLLSENLSDTRLVEFYQSLLASEARHNATYLSLAEEYFPRDSVRIRLLELADIESSILREPSELIRIHT